MTKKKKKKGVKMNELVMDDNIQYFDFLCPHCKSKRIDMRSLTYSFKPDLLDNSDIIEKNKKEGLRLKQLPTLKEAILNTRKDDLLVCCNDCGIASRIDADIERSKLRKWLKKTYGAMVLCL